MDTKNIIKEYSNGEVTVVWQAGKCIHSGNCVKNLPAVFKPKEQPWVQVENAASAAIIDAVAKCPSGALSIKK
ncbi:MAG: (4Fe-4S)-binding protein [Ferruginibacter sp.]|nr:(4Fe-4S)-binding protein [Ferruginibacter sp.]